MPWPRELPLLELCYHLLSWIPSLQDDPESQVYLELITRAITETSHLNGFHSQFVVGEPRDINLERACVREAIRNILAPIVVGDIGLNEDILETFLRTAINFLTVHQAKGLEFPVVIVDVGAHFPTNHPSHRRLRFPEQQEGVHLREDLTHPHGGLSGVAVRQWRDRAFDDLVRLYYVAFSRPQTLLVLVGVNPALPQGTIRNVALGWTRTGASAWRTNLPIAMI